MAQTPSKQEIAHRFFAGTSVTYDRMVRFGTCGLDALWKTRLLAHVPADPARVVDQACGTGIVTLALARRFPKCRVTGVELHEEYLQRARAKLLVSGIENVALVLGRAEDIVVEGAQDCIVSSYLAKYADLPALIANARAMLRPGGVFVMHDFAYPRRAVFRCGWQVYFRAMSLFGRRLFPEWRVVFDELPGLLRSTRWVSEASALLRGGAFDDVRVETLTFGAAAIVVGRKAPLR